MINRGQQITDTSILLKITSVDTCGIRGPTEGFKHGMFQRAGEDTAGDTWTM